MCQQVDNVKQCAGEKTDRCSDADPIAAVMPGKQDRQDNVQNGRKDACVKAHPVTAERHRKTVHHQIKVQCCGIKIKAGIVLKSFCLEITEIIYRIVENHSFQQYQAQCHYNGRSYAGDQTCAEYLICFAVISLTLFESGKQ